MPILGMLVLAEIGLRFHGDVAIRILFTAEELKLHFRDVLRDFGGSPKW